MGYRSLVKHLIREGQIDSYQAVLLVRALKGNGKVKRAIFRTAINQVRHDSRIALSEDQFNN